jgi:hypothetical protein
VFAAASVAVGLAPSIVDRWVFALAIVVAGAAWLVPELLAVPGNLTLSSRRLDDSRSAEQGVHGEHGGAQWVVGAVGNGPQIKQATVG